MLKMTKQDLRLIKLMRTLVNISKRDGYFEDNKKDKKELESYEKLVSILESVVEGLR